jgi:hypothetical protein
MQRLRCPGGWITALGGQRQAMHERPGQRQGNSQQQPHPQAPGEKCPHAQGPFVVPREVLRRLPPLSRANHVLSRLRLQSHLVTHKAVNCVTVHGTQLTGVLLGARTFGELVGKTRS